MMAHTKTNKKPISRDYALTSDDGPHKDQQKTNIQGLALTRDDDPTKDQQKTNI